MGMQVRGSLGVLAAVVIAGAGCGADEGATVEVPEVAASEAAWQALPESPLSPRYDSYAFGVGERLVLIGGTTEPPCPPTADCTVAHDQWLRDGATYDFTSGRWHGTTPAPVDLRWGRGVVVGSAIYVLPSSFEPGGDHDRPLLRYDVEGDEWSRLPLPPVEDPDWLALEAAGDRLLAYPSSHEQGHAADYVFDSATESWTRLPRDPLAPSFDRQLVQVGEDLVLLAHDLVDQPGSETPSYVRAAVLDDGSRNWRPLPDSELLGGASVAVAGRLVSPVSGGADGGETNPYGRTIPYGGLLDPSTGEWSELPPADGVKEGGLPGRLHATQRLALLSGRALDPVRKRWVDVPALPGLPENGVAEAMVGDRLVAWGGYEGYGSEATFVEEGWYWQTPTAS